MSIDSTTSVMNWTSAGAHLSSNSGAPREPAQVEVFERNERRIPAHLRLGLTLGLSMSLWALVAYVCLQVI